METLLPVLAFLVGAGIFKKDRLAFVILAVTAIVPDAWYYFIGWDGFYLFRGVIYFSAALFCLNHSKIDKRHALILAMMIGWYALLAIEDSVNTLYMPMDLVYTNFERTAYAIALLHFFVAIDNAFPSLRNRSFNYFNR